MTDSFTPGLMSQQSHCQYQRAPTCGPGPAFANSVLAEDGVTFCLESPPDPCEDRLLVTLCSFHNLLHFCIPLIKDEPFP